MKIKNLRDALVRNFEQLEAGRFRNSEIDHLKEMNRTAQNILHSAKIELAYAKMHERKTVIDFLENEEPESPGNLKFINPPTSGN